MRIDRLPSRVLGPATIAAVLILLLLPATALGHAELESSSPGVGATVTGPLEQAVLTFTDDLRSGSFFRIEAAGRQVARGNIDPENADQMIAQTSSLGPGTYTVKWRTVATDGDAANGQFEFTIVAPTPAPPSPTPAPTPSESASAAPTASPSAAPSPSPTATPTQVPVPTASPAPTPAAATGGEVVIPIVATLVVVGGLGLWVLRRQRRI